LVPFTGDLIRLKVAEEEEAASKRPLKPIFVETVRPLLRQKNLSS
jgi:hypothetical protein